MKTEIIEILKSGGVGVLPTDTIYGLVGSAFSQASVERIYKVKGRNPEKPLIVLIASLDDLEKFGVETNQYLKKFLEQVWPGKVSVILPFSNQELSYLNKKGTLAFRLPEENDLVEILKETGPLVAPSANPEGQKHAINIKEAKEYFKDEVDFYLDKGDLESLSSTLVEVKDNKIKILREGEDLEKISF